jgi:hypothetical protein
LIQAGISRSVINNNDSAMIEKKNLSNVAKTFDIRFLVVAGNQESKIAKIQLDPPSSS